MHTVSVSFGPVRRIRTTYIARGVAGLLIIMLLAQLFGYESFSSLLAVVLPFNDQLLTDLLAAKLVVVELLALPYLLAMPLSRLMRGLSLLCGAASATFWLFTSLTSAHAGNAVLFSDTIPISGGLLPFLWCLALAVGFGYVVNADLRSRTS